MFQGIQTVLQLLRTKYFSPNYNARDKTMSNLCLDPTCIGHDPICSVIGGNWSVFNFELRCQVAMWRAELLKYLLLYLLCVIILEFYLLLSWDKGSNRCRGVSFSCDCGYEKLLTFVYSQTATEISDGSELGSFHFHATVRRKLLLRM